ncbi:hypothetical protein Bca52824_047559 [Brassica carinata]|uniref:Uncharacterized protein n=1 Tax=Brassica carinata TaxID=52824 RepID=A0A8X7UQ29_BRACI|nr:hypothetical protein Bca52824_047559 [Brassica carinata]
MLLYAVLLQSYVYTLKVVALLWDPCNRPTDAEALYVPSFQVHQRVCASDAMAVTVPVLIS